MSTTLKTTPAYLAFVAALQTRVTVPSREIAGYVCFEHPVSKHKVYVDKSVRGLNPVHTTLPLPDNTPGLLPAKPGTGKCVARIPAELEAVVNLINSLGEGTLRPNMRKAVAVQAIVPTYSEQDFEEEALMYQTTTH